MSRVYVNFSWKEANLRICSSRAGLIIEEIKRQRALLEEYIRIHPQFQTTLVPIELLEEAPPIARRMQAAALLAGVGPMAAVAGAMAQWGVEAAMRAGAGEAIVENGGDIYLNSPDEVIVGMYAGDHPLSGKLAFRVPPSWMPLSICSSSSRFGHSLSFGQCDLATIISGDGALADAAATLAGNSVRAVEDVDGALEKVAAIPGIRGVLIIQETRVGLIGDLPELVRVEDREFARKAVHARTS